MSGICCANTSAKLGLPVLAHGPKLLKKTSLDFGQLTNRPSSFWKQQLCRNLNCARFRSSRFENCLGSRQSPTSYRQGFQRPSSKARRYVDRGGMSDARRSQTFCHHKFLNAKVSSDPLGSLAVKHYGVHPLLRLLHGAYGFP